MIPPDGTVIRFTKGFYTDCDYMVVENGQLRSWDEKFEIIFWEFSQDGCTLGPLGEAKWYPECEKLEVEYIVIRNGRGDGLPGQTQPAYGDAPGIRTCQSPHTGKKALDGGASLG